MQTGTIAGNLMTKYTYPEFPSDLFLVLETVGARVQIASGPLPSDSVIMPLNDFLAEPMDRKVLLKVILPARDSDAFLLKTYKVSTQQP